MIAFLLPSKLWTHFRTLDAFYMESTIRESNITRVYWWQIPKFCSVEKKGFLVFMCAWSMLQLWYWWCSGYRKTRRPRLESSWKYKEDVYPRWTISWDCWLYSSRNLQNCLPICGERVHQLDLDLEDVTSGSTKRGPAAAHDMYHPNHIHSKTRRNRMTNPQPARSWDERPTPPYRGPRGCSTICTKHTRHAWGRQRISLSMSSHTRL